MPNFQNTVSVDKMLTLMKLFKEGGGPYTLHCPSGVNCRYIAYNQQKTDAWLCKDATCEGDADGAHPLPHGATVTVTDHDVEVRMPSGEFWNTVHAKELNSPNVDTQIDTVNDGSTTLLVKTFDRRDEQKVVELLYTSKSTYAPPKTSAKPQISKVAGGLRVLQNQVVVYTFLFQPELTIGTATYTLKLESPRDATTAAATAEVFQEDLLGHGEDIGDVLTWLDVFPHDVLTAGGDAVALHARVDEACDHVVRNGDIAMLCKDACRATGTSHALKGGAVVTMGRDEIRLAVKKDWFRRRLHSLVKKEAMSTPLLANRILTLRFDRVAPGEQTLCVVTLRGGKSKKAEVLYTSEADFKPPALDKRNNDRRFVWRVYGSWKDLGTRVVFTAPFESELVVFKGEEDEKKKKTVTFRVRRNDGKSVVMADASDAAWSGFGAAAPTSARNVDANAVVQSRRLRDASPSVTGTWAGRGLQSQARQAGTVLHNQARRLGHTLSPGRFGRRVLASIVGGREGEGMKKMLALQEKNKENTIAVEARIAHAQRTRDELMGSARRRGHFSCEAMRAEHRQTCQAALQYATQGGRLKFAWEM